MMVMTLGLNVGLDEFERVAPDGLSRGSIGGFSCLKSRQNKTPNLTLEIKWF